MNIYPPKRVSFLNNPSVWLEFSPLSNYYDSINLGQGFPDWEPPKFVQDFAKESVTGGETSGYARSAGDPKLTRALALQYEAQLNQKLDPYRNILVTVGASEALFLAITSYVEVDDEVIVIEPAFDIYTGILKMAQADIKTVSLNDSLELDWEKLKRVLSPKTRMIILNTPHNPSGKVFSRDELLKLASLLDKAPDCLVVSDEVYEHLVYDDLQHISIASLANLFERTITVSSAGKTFATTGWKIGWCVGPKHLIHRLQLCQQWVVFSVSKPHQQAIANSINYANKNNYYEMLRKQYQKKRDLLYQSLYEAGLNPIRPEGSFFILCDINGIHLPDKTSEIKRLISEDQIQVDDSTLHLHDYNFCRALAMDIGVTAIPVSAFYQVKEDNQKWARFAFCKEDQTLVEAMKRLKSLKKKTQKLKP